MKVIAFSLWGEKPMYTVGALKNAELAETIYPGWECWFYIGASTLRAAPWVAAALKRKDNCRVIEMEEEGDWSAMFWRFLPAADSGVSAMISRDCDSRLNLREKEAVDVWLKQGTDFHIMRDHPYHGIQMLGGMWGVRKGKLSDVEELVEGFTKGDYWQVDQEFLKLVVFPRAIGHCTIHDGFFEDRPFPSRREGESFVGEAFTENDEPLHPEHRTLLCES